MISENATHSRVGVWIRQNREDLGLGTAQVASMVGIDAPWLEAIESGEAEAPTVVLEAIADALKLPYMELLRRIDPERVEALHAKLRPQSIEEVLSILGLPLPDDAPAADEQAASA